MPMQGLLQVQNLPFLHNLPLLAYLFWYCTQD